MSRRRPCVQCRLRRCHTCRDDDGEPFWFPHCMGGAVWGDPGHCTCWPETAKQRARRIRAMNRARWRSIHAAVASWRRKRADGLHAAELEPPFVVLRRLEVL